MKYNIGRITSATKYGALGAGCLGLGTALLVPVLGVLAHIGGGTLTDASLHNYSLKNRFETAYSFNTPEEHKSYYYTMDAFYPDEYHKTYYLASPYATYGVIALGGLAGLLLGGRIGLNEARSREEEARTARIARDMQQKLR